MAKKTLWDRAIDAVGPRNGYVTKDEARGAWLAGRRAGMQDSRKLLAKDRARVKKVLQNVAAQHEAVRKAEHEFNVQRIELERERRELQLRDQRRERDDDRRAAILQSRLPVRNGGYAP